MDVVDVITLHEMIFDERSNEMVNVVDMATLFDDIRGFSKVECGAIVIIEVERKVLSETELIGSVDLVN